MCCSGWGWSSRPWTAAMPTRCGWRSGRTRSCCTSRRHQPDDEGDDLAAVAAIARTAGATLIVDNTFASPYNQRPLELGAHAVVHSSTKYLNGHSDVIGGIVVTSDDEIAASCASCRGAGAVPAVRCLAGAARPEDAARAHGAAQRERAARGRVPGGALRPDRVFYPGLPTHPQHELARRRCAALPAW